jgi:HlyD family secretion protein
MSARQVIALAAGVVVVGAVFVLTRSDRNLAVDAEPVTRRAVFTSFVTASGQIVATRYADIGASAMGRLVKLAVKEGDAVQAGQLLARIDAVQAGASATAAAARVKGAEADERGAAEQLQSARADVVAAEARALEATQNFARARDLKSQGIVSDAELDRAKANADAAAAQVSAVQAAWRRVQQARESAARRLAEAQADAARMTDVLSKTEIRSPIAGLVTRLPVQEGEMVVIGIQNQPGTPLMTVSDLSAIDAEVKVAEADVLRLTVGQTARVTLEALPGTAFSGHVAEIGASALPVAGSGPAAREFRVKVRLDSPDPRLRPGLTCDAEVLSAERKNVLTVPLQSVVLRPGPGGTDTTGVFVAEGKIARYRTVQTGLIGGLEMEVTGVAEGTSVIAGPFQALRALADGQAIRVVARPQ